MKNTIIACTLLVLATCFCTGCSGGRPSGFPKVKPCTVTVTDGTSPLAEIHVQLISDTPLASTVVFGNTDATGLAVISTIFAGHNEIGAPEGTYTVVLSKDYPLVHTKSDVEIENMSYDEAMKYQKDMEAARDKLPKIIPASLSQRTSPLKLTVDSTGGTLDVDITQHK